MRLTIGTTQDGKPFGLPIEAVTETFAILAKKGYGKSYTSDVLIEELLKANQQVVVIDPTGAHWGLQSSADGKNVGFPIVVFGGDHANVPLEDSAGEVIARAIIEKRFSAIVDLSHFRKGVGNRFVGIFLETLYRLNREPLHLIVDEADAFAPQRLMGEEARTCGAMEDIVRRGRIRGIGCTLITQRPQTINKNVLTQVDTLICGNLSHPKDIGAIEEWIDVHADPKEAKAMVESLPVLPKGTLWFWSPSWGGFFDKIKVRERRTFNSGATPKPGEKVRAPQKLAPVDIEALGKTIAETVERKKADDPKALRQKIAQLEKDLAKKLATSPAAKPMVETKRVEVPVLKDGQLKRAESILERMVALRDSLTAPITELSAACAKVNAPATKVVQPSFPKQSVNQTVVRTPRPAPQKLHTGERAAEIGTGGLYRILVALAQEGAPLTYSTAAARAGVSVKGGSFRTWLSTGRTNGWISEPQRGSLAITEAGLEGLGDFDPLPTGEALHSFWKNKVGGTPARMLDALIQAYPDVMTYGEIAEALQVSESGGSFRTWISTLATLQLIEKPGTGQLRASDNLFD